MEYHPSRGKLLRSLGVAAAGALLPAVADAAPSAANTLVERFIEIVNSRDPDRFVEIMASGYVQHQEGIASGRVAAIAFFKKFPATVRLELVHAIAEGDYVAAVMRVMGTAQGQKVDQLSVDAWRIENGVFAAEPQGFSNLQEA